MKLKKITLNGFKSFGEKTEIVFEHNLNGIVGPNGSGKSNIIDAIKWVLGQQRTSELRAKSNIDIIFSGSENKKPKNVAEVILEFDNSDQYLDIEYTTVSFKRRLFRNGDNEYYINDNRCRLKDINNLILDKGFGKDSFSIISQGKVEEIIMAKPDKRREMIDEVAGVQKYRVKKNIVNRKLEKLDINIDKINFIVEELESSLKPLEEAATKAKIYQKYAKELEKKERMLIVNEISQFKEHLIEVESDFLKVDKELNESNNKIQNSETKLQEFDQKMMKFQEEIVSINEQVNKNKNEELILVNQLSLIKEKQSMYKGDNSNRIEVLDKHLKAIKEEENQIQIKLSSSIPRKDKAFRDLEDIKNDYSISKKRFYEYEKELSNLKEAKDKQTYPYPVKRILELNDESVLGTVSDNVKIYGGYELAINTILGNRKNEIITVNETVVKSLITYLKQNKLGKVTFAPINKVFARKIDMTTLSSLEKNRDLYLGLGIDFVDYEDKFTNVIGSLLGNIIICKDIEQANKLGKIINSKYQIVTLEGDVFLTSGKISGGYDKNISSLSIDKKIKNLTDSINKLNLSKIEKDLEQKTSEYMQLNLEVEVNQNKLKNMQKEMNDISLEYNSLMKKGNNESNINILSLEEKLEDIKKIILELIKQKNLIEVDHKNISEKRIKYSDELLQLRADYKTLSSSFAHLEVEVIQVKSKVKELLEQLGQTYAISYEKAYESTIKIDNLKPLKKEVVELKGKIKELGFINEESIKEYDLKKEQFDYYMDQKNDLNCSKDKILEILQKLDTFVITKFEEAFEKLNKEFKEIYVRLFDGGNATLILTNPEDLLNSGVEIIAQPPGKKSQVIGLLSGGEKSLTAIALLFAILRVRVVPFAILDEVEAALDEANVVRYIQYLKVFSLNTQFLVITHRQSTMEKVDKLYGVTMIEKGISSIIDIDLKK